MPKRQFGSEKYVTEIKLKTGIGDPQPKQSLPGVTTTKYVSGHHHWFFYSIQVFFRLNPLGLEWKKATFLKDKLSHKTCEKSWHELNRNLPTLLDSVWPIECLNCLPLKAIRWYQHNVTKIQFLSKNHFHEMDTFWNKNLTLNIVWHFLFKKLFYLWTSISHRLTFSHVYLCGLSFHF